MLSHKDVEDAETAEECFSCVFLGTETCIHPDYAKAYTSACADFEPKEEAQQEEASVEPERYFEKNKFVPKWLADDILEQHKFATHRDSHKIWVYTNGVYVPNGEEVIRESSRRMLGDASKERPVSEVVNHIRETTYTPPEQFEAPITLVNVKNGVLDIETGELRVHTPDIIFTSELPVDYDPKAECPKTKKFFRDVLHKDDIPVMQEIIGYCLLRDYRFAKAVMLLGEGANAKSTALNLIAALVGERNVATPSLQGLINNRFAVASLYGKLVNIHADVPTYKLRYTGTFKMLTGQDIMYAEHKHANAFEFRNYAKLLYSANELPQTDDMSEAFWRRWIVIDFPNIFSDGDPRTDPNILEKLTTPKELSGFLNWALKGLHRLLKNNKFSTSKSREDIEREWIAQTDSLRAFVTDRVTLDPACYIIKDDFYDVYTNFCYENEISPVEKAVVGRKLPTILPKVIGFYPGEKGKQKKAWKGIRLLDEPGKYNRENDRDSGMTDMMDKSTTYIYDLSNDINKKNKPTYPSYDKKASPPTDTCGDCGSPLRNDKKWFGLGLGYLCPKCHDLRTGFT